MRVRSDDPAYQELARREAEFWERSPFTVGTLEALFTERVRRFLNASYTGDPDVGWLEHLIARGPFRRAAMLGSTGGIYERLWQRSSGSRYLAVYEISDGVIARTRVALRGRRLGLPWPSREVRFVRADLNFVRLPADSYDAVWTTGCIRHVTNLEHLFDEIDRSLRPGGFFALHDTSASRGWRSTRSASGW
jgi:SAM-dependent methyltransferase